MYINILTIYCACSSRLLGCWPDFDIHFNSSFPKRINGSPIRDSMFYSLWFMLGVRWGATPKIITKKIECVVNTIWWCARSARLVFICATLKHHIHMHRYTQEPPTFRPSKYTQPREKLWFFKQTDITPRPAYRLMEGDAQRILEMYSMF